MYYHACQNLYKAHTVARRGKRNEKGVIEFELHLGENLIELSESLKNGTYEISGYYSFMVYAPKKREIHALHYVHQILKNKLRRVVLDKNIFLLLCN